MTEGRVGRELREWRGHPPDVLQGMLDGLSRLREQGRYLIAE